MRCFFSAVDRDAMQLIGSLYMIESRCEKLFDEDMSQSKETNENSQGAVCLLSFSSMRVLKKQTSSDAEAS